jgi:hypothetical protein
VTATGRQVAPVPGPLVDGLLVLEVTDLAGVERWVTAMRAAGADGSCPVMAHVRVGLRPVGRRRRLLRRGLRPGLGALVRLAAWPRASVGVPRPYRKPPGS